MDIKLYEHKYRDEYVMLIHRLWFDISDEDISTIINEHDENNKIFLAIEEDHVIGFLNTSIRTDYVEGSNSSRTGYVEGIFVQKEFRTKNVARRLLLAAFQFFKSIQIHEVGSDIEIDNHISAAFHEKIGFKEVSRNIHYIIKVE